jgi:DNA-binding MarR family transcriptional regulator
MDAIGRTLNPEEQAILIVLSQEGRLPGDRTPAGLAMALERDPLDVSSVLARLERDSLVTRGEEAGKVFWSVAATG